MCVGVGVGGGVGGGGGVVWVGTGGWVSKDKGFQDKTVTASEPSDMYVAPSLWNVLPESSKEKDSI